MSDFKFHVEHSMMEDCFNLFGVNDIGHAYEEIQPATVEHKETPKGMAITSNPFFRLSSMEAQRLFDAMYSAGLRPSKYQGQGGKEATAKHLEDMRKIVSAKLRIEL